MRVPFFAAVVVVNVENGDDDDGNTDNDDNDDNDVATNVAADIKVKEGGVALG